MVLKLVNLSKFKLVIIGLVAVIFSLIESVDADIYIDFSDTLISTSELLGANGDRSKERYIILNGVPITTKIYNINLKHNHAIEKLSNEANKVDYKAGMDDNNSMLLGLEPTVVVTKNWSAIYKINLEQFSSDKLRKNTVGNYITLAKKISLNQSMIIELVFEDANDMKKLLFDVEEEVKCEEVLNIQRFPASRRKFCLTEVTSEKISSQIIIFEGGGNPGVRINHYNNELAELGYRTDVIDRNSSDKSILFASNNFSNTTIFTYKSNNKVLDIIQSHF